MTRQPEKPARSAREAPASDPLDGDPRAPRSASAQGVSGPGASEQGDVTVLLERWLGGQKEAEEPLLRLVYDELRRLAGRYMSRERSDHTLPPTGLVHEAYLRLVRSDLDAGTIENRVHFFAVAAQAMRRILVEHARSYQTQRRASPHRRTVLDEGSAWDRIEPTSTEILAVDEALRRLRATHPRPARIAELRYFAGLTEHEVAAALDISRSSVARDWRLARMMLRSIMTESERTGPEP